MSGSNELDWTEDEARIRAAVEGAASRKQVLLNLGVTSSPHNSLRKLRDACERFSIELPYGLARLDRAPEWQLRERAERLFVKDGTKNIGSTLKMIAFKLGMLEESCDECGIGPEWNGSHIVLHLDHINGVNTDHRIENLRILCPNCHSQTETYCGKNRL